METLYEDEDCWLGKYYDKEINNWVLSTKIYNWSLSKYKKYLSILGQVLAKDNTMYLSYVRGKKEKKFNLLFGFKETNLKFKYEGIEFEVLYVWI